CSADIGWGSCRSSWQRDDARRRRCGRRRSHCRCLGVGVGRWRACNCRRKHRLEAIDLQVAVTLGPLEDLADGALAGCAMQLETPGEITRLRLETGEGGQGLQIGLHLQLTE